MDASSEVLAINRERLGGAPVKYVQADLFEWQPDPAAYDVCFFGFWLSHVPEERFATFWETVRAALRPGGRVFFIDSARASRATAAHDRLPAPGEDVMTRTLNDGREFRVVKRYYEPRRLEQRLTDLGWNVHVRSTGEFFIYGFELARSGPASGAPAPAAGGWHAPACG